MQNTGNIEPGLYNHVTDLIKGHEKLLADEERNRAFYAALESCVTSNTTVLDIGSGSGIWAIVAARLGARLVVAVEQDPMLIGVIRSLAQANGVGDRVQAIAGDSKQIGFGQKFDVIISETIGNLAFEEQIIPTMIDARARHLSPGGLLIPRSVALVACPARFISRPHLPAGVMLEYEKLEWMARHIPVGLEDRSRVELVAEPKELIRIDLRTVEDSPAFSNLEASWEVADTSTINGVAIWASATLTEGVELNAFKTTSWTPLMYRTTPFSKNQGTFGFNLSLTSTTNYWSVSLKDQNATEMQSYSPEFLASILVAQGKTAADLLAPEQRTLFTARTLKSNQ